MYNAYKHTKTFGDTAMSQKKDGYKSRKNENALRILSGILLIISILVIYLTHRAIPFMMDDLWYSTLLSEDTPIASFSDIVRSQIWHYFNWGGRSMTHAILQMVLLAGEQTADILNVAVTLLLAGAICLVSENRTLPAFFAAFGMMFGLNANWKMSMFWQAGAANYLYITVFILLFAYCYLRELPDEGTLLFRSKKAVAKGTSKAASAVEAFPPGCTEALKPLPFIRFWIIPLGILTGWSNENMGPSLWLLSLAVILLTWREKHTLKLWMLLGNLSCLVGSAFCILAPGNFVRSAQSGEAQIGLLWRLFLRCYAQSKSALEFLFPTLLVLFFLCILHGPKRGRRNELLLLTALLSWGAFLLSPHYPDRASFGTMILCICAALSLAKKAVLRDERLVLPLWALSVFIWLRGMYFCGEFLAITWGWI